MALLTLIQDDETGITARLTEFGALAVSPSKASTAFNAFLGEDDVPVNVVKADASQTFCITGMILTGNKLIDNVTDAIVTIYTTSDSTSSTQEDVILSIPIARSANIPILGILLTAPKGKFINAVTTDDDVFVTILGFFIDSLID